MMKIKYCEYNPRSGLVEHISQTEAAQQSVIQFLAVIVINLVPPKAAAKQELLFNKLASEA